MRSLLENHSNPSARMLIKKIQDLEEIGVVEDRTEYVEIMSLLKLEIERRLTTAIALLAIGEK